MLLDADSCCIRRGHDAVISDGMLVAGGVFAGEGFEDGAVAK